MLLRLCWYCKYMYLKSMKVDVMLTLLKVDVDVIYTKKPFFSCSFWTCFTESIKSSISIISYCHRFHLHHLIPEKSEDGSLFHCSIISNPLPVSHSLTGWSKSVCETGY